MTVSLRPSSNRTGGFPASGFPNPILAHHFRFATETGEAKGVRSLHSTIDKFLDEVIRSWGWLDLYAWNSPGRGFT